MEDGPPPVAHRRCMTGRDARPMSGEAA